MITPRPYASLAGSDAGWLKARLHFRFAGMGRPEYGAVGALHVWNDDEFAPDSGFPMHAHRNVEIITYVRRGAITHADSLGNQHRIEAGDVQVMSAGEGIVHSEHNRENEPTLLYQIWLHPRTAGGAPSWRTKRFPRPERSGRLAVLASGDATDQAEGALPLSADARLLAATLQAGERIEHRLSGRAYVVAVNGRLAVNATELAARDGAVIDGEQRLTLSAIDATEVLLMEVA
ncbi:pirin family protein [Duganella callida]|uniref:Pirin family protein n=1 Tax=Duganella callida TaxID=2561932 RepID=A0A4Y9SIK4_9BURK|nr:pirin family protein [Duganella callida]TFW20608.1 pirin family protein [Duganella callida]